MIIRALLLLMLSVGAAGADEVARNCAVRTTDNVVTGCWNIDPAVSPAPTDTTWAADPNSQGGPNATYNPATQTFSPPPLTPEEQAAKDASDAVEARQQQLRALSDVQDLASRLQTSTPTQIDTWVDSNVSNVAQARTLFKAILKLLAYQLRQP